MNAPNLTDRRQLLSLLRQAEQDPNPFRKDQVIRQAIEEMETVAEDNGGQAYPVFHRRVWDPVGGAYIEVQFAPNCFLVVPAPPALAPGGAPSAPVRLNFTSGAGMLIGWRGSVWDTTPGALAAGELERVTCQVQARLGTDTDLVTNGVGGDFVPYADVFAAGQAFSPLLREVCSTDVLQIIWRNVQPVGASTLQPSLTFAYYKIPKLR